VTAVEYGRTVLRQIAARCEAEPAREACGFVLRRGGALEVVELANVADAYHAREPVQFPRTSRESYLMDPRALLRLHGELAAAGGEIVAVWHSHVEGGAHFSAKDRSDAVVDGIEQVPGAEYLVVSLRGGRADELRRYRRDALDFVEVPLPER
jgi:proteasome lid subunit RPN8/RPN11